MHLRIKRIHDPAPEDGTRVLVGRVWPRGVSKQAAQVYLWLKAAAPSTSLRRWFGHDPARWAKFRRRYREELGGKRRPLRSCAARPLGRVTLLFAARDTAHNNAVALRKFIERR